MFSGKTPADEAYQQQQTPQFQHKDRLSDKKRKKTLDIWEQPLWPPMARILFICFILLSIAMSLVEVKNFIIDPAKDLQLLVRNASLNLLVLWLMMLVLEALCCFFNTLSINKTYKRRRAENGITALTPEDLARSKRAMRKLNAPCRQYVRISAAGTIIFVLLYLLMKLL